MIDAGNNSSPKPGHGRLPPTISVSDLAGLSAPVAAVTLVYGARYGRKERKAGGCFLSGKRLGKLTGLGREAANAARLEMAERLPGVTLVRPSPRRVIVHFDFSAPGFFMVPGILGRGLVADLEPPAALVLLRLIVDKKSRTPRRLGFKEIAADLGFRATYVRKGLTSLKSSGLVSGRSGSLKITDGPPPAPRLEPAPPPPPPPAPPPLPPPPPSAEVRRIERKLVRRKPRDGEQFDAFMSRAREEEREKS